jgi:hypothetical protein
MSINVQQDATIHSLSVNCCACFGWFLHPSSGAQLIVSAIVTGINNGWLVPDAVDKVSFSPDDGWRNHPKHVEQIRDKINCV